MNETDLDSLIAESARYAQARVDRLGLGASERHVVDQIVATRRDAAQRPGRPRRQRLLTLAAASLVAVAGVGVWKLTDRTPTPASSATTTTTTDSNVVPSAGLTWPPRLLLDDSWTAVYLDEAISVSEDIAAGARCLTGDMRFVRAMDEVEITWSADPINLAAALATPAAATSLPGGLTATVLGETVSVVAEDPGPQGTAVEPRVFRLAVLRPEGVISLSVSIQDPEVLGGVLESLRTVDLATWDLAVPAYTVTPAERTEAVDQILDGVPLPPGFDVEPFRTAPLYSDRYQLTFHVINSVVCRWVDLWFTARENGETTRADDAAAALLTARDWPALLQVADEGGSAESTWVLTDAVNGIGGIMTGGGPMPPTRELVAGGCADFWSA